MKKYSLILVAIALVLCFALSGCALVFEHVALNLPSKQVTATLPNASVEEILNKNTQQNASQRPQAKPDYSPKGEYNKGVVLVKNKDGVKNSTLTSIFYKSVEQLYAGSTWYKITLKDNQDTEEAVRALAKTEHFEEVDYDYIMQADGEVQSVDISGNGYDPDPDHLETLGIHKAWLNSGGNNHAPGGIPDVIVAVIDTGVDYNHEDLRNNIWINTAEIPDNGIDDDYNGYIDDVRGWDCVGNDNDPMDDNGHGTHVAGIVAAENNKVGTVGVAFNCKVMVIKAGNSSGNFNNSDIVEAIQYAYMNGASVINMSFGSYAISTSVEDALMDAYNQCVLVAAAGNDTRCNQPDCLIHRNATPAYPAALSYVIGVMSCDNGGNYCSSFSNFDHYPNNSFEYEVYAPGEAIPSTWPGNKYARLNGTSMAAPTVAGIAALLRSYYTDREVYSNKFIQSQIVNTGKKKIDSHAIVDAYLALTQIPTPDVKLYDAYIFDNVEFSSKNNGNGIIEAGETIRVGVELMNYGGVASNVVATIDTIRNGDANLTDPYFDITTSQITMSDIGTYSVRNSGLIKDNDMIVGVENYFEFVVAENCPNDYLCVFNVIFSYTNGLDEKDNTVYTNAHDPIPTTFDVSVVNGVLLPTQFTEDTTLTADNLYILPYSTYIHEGVTVTIEPGTRIQFYTDDTDSLYYETGIPVINVAGKLISNGSADAPVEMFPCDSMGNYIVDIERAGASYIELNYTNITNGLVSADKVDHCYFSQTYTKLFYRYLENGKVKYDYVSRYTRQLTYNIYQCYSSVFYKLGGDYTENNPVMYGCVFNTCIFIDSSFSSSVSEFVNCVFQGNMNISAGALDDASSLTLDPTRLQMADFYYDTTTGTAYSLAYADMALSKIRWYLQKIGGDVACVETEAELEFIRNTVTKKCGLGLELDSDTWMNGAPVADFIEALSPATQDGDTLTVAPGGYFSYAWVYQHASYGTNYWLFEFPNCSYDNVADIQSQCDWVNKEGYNNYSFNGNAILNNLNDTDVEHWLRIQGSEGYNSSKSVGLAGNYWGTTNEALIDKMIIDFDDHQSLADIVWKNYLTEAPSNTFPFVTDIYFINKDGEIVKTIGKETVQVVVKFNRDMDTSIPLNVTFGSRAPYADYKIEGDYVDARTWMGEYTLKAGIENGSQYFRIQNGCAAGDPFLKLYESDGGRLGFEIDTTSAQSMMMQAVADDGQINLTWMQDDYDTLLGYNIYRSTEKDGEFARINQALVPAGENTFADANTEAGAEYWYTFTVVQTDFAESAFAGKVSCVAPDSIRPTISHTPVAQGILGNSLAISATVTDNIAVTSVKIYYRTVGATEWKSLTMNKQNDNYRVTIFSSELSVAGLEYYIVASDGQNTATMGSAEQPLTVAIKDPSAPDVPDQPDTPDVPDQPDTPDVPDQPDTPDVPDQPDTPDVPDQPDTPDVPDNPDTPNNPNTPDQPGQPDTPDETGNPLVVIVVAMGVGLGAVIAVLVGVILKKRKS